MRVIAIACLVGCSNSPVVPDVPDARATDSGAAPDAPSCANQPWTMETAISDGRKQFEGTLDVDGSGSVHLSSTYKASTSGVHYAHRAPGGGWTVEDASMAGIPIGSSMVHAADGQIHIAFATAATTFTVATADRDVGGTWTGYQLQANGTPETPSNAMTSNGRLHIAYPPSDRSTVCYMWRDPVSGWSSCASFGDPGAQAHRVSLASDPGGAIHVAYWDSYNSKIELASRDSVGAWTIDPVQADSMNGAGGSRWLVIDAAGTVHLAYPDATGLVYAQRNAGVWAKERADPTPKLGCNASLVVDAAGFASIIYKSCLVGTAGVWFAHRGSSSTWSVTQLDATADNLGPAMLGIGPDSRLHAAWVNSAGDVVYATTPCP